MERATQRDPWERDPYHVEFACCDQDPEEFVVVSEDGHRRIGSVMDPLTKEQAEIVATMLSGQNEYWACEGDCSPVDLAPHIHYGENVILGVEVACKNWT